MKKFIKYLSFAVVFAMLFTSCSKDNENVIDKPESDMASISFATVLNDLTAKKAAVKQAVSDFPECSDAAPAYIEVVLSGTEDIGTMAAPLVVNVSPDPGDYDDDGQEEYFTEESSELELEPGSYSLEFFAVYDVNNNLIWVAPIAGGDISTFVNDPLPMDIELAAGVKKYVDVEVLCFDDRVVNEYGYLFFDLDTIEAFEFCFFANFCNENGRHFPAHYSVDIWLGTDDTGTLLYADEMNAVENEGEEASADPLCFALPNLPQFEDDEDYIYYEVTLEDWEGVYGDIDQTMISGTLSREDVEANFVGEDRVDYEHLRFGCGDDGDNGEEPLDSDEDGVPDSQDNCPDEANEDQADADGDGIGDVCDECPQEAGSEENEGCPDEDEAPDADEDGEPDSTDNCINTANPDQADTDSDGIGDVCDDCPEEAGTEENNGCPDEDEMPDADEDGVPDSEDNCLEMSNPDQADSDGDGIGNVCDDCPNEAGPEANNGCPDEDEGEVCVMESPDQGCINAYLEGNNGWVQIQDPGSGEIPDPLRLMEIGNNTIYGTITCSLDNEGNPVIVLDSAPGLDDYLIEVSQNQDGSGSACVVEEDITIPSGEEEPDALIEFDEENFSYPFYVRIEANVCPPM